MSTPVDDRELGEETLNNETLCNITKTSDAVGERLDEAGSMRSNVTKRLHNERFEIDPNSTKVGSVLVGLERLFVEGGGTSSLGSGAKSGQLQRVGEGDVNGEVLAVGESREENVGRSLGAVANLRKKIHRLEDGVNMSLTGDVAQPKLSFTMTSVGITTRLADGGVLAESTNRRRASSVRHRAELVGCCDLMTNDL